MKPITEFLLEYIDPDDRKKVKMYMDTVEKTVEDIQKSVGSAADVEVTSSPGGKSVLVTVYLDEDAMESLPDSEDVFRTAYERTMEQACSRLGLDLSEFKEDCGYTVFWDNRSDEDDCTMFDCTFDDQDNGDMLNNVPCLVSMLAGCAAIMDIPESKRRKCAKAIELCIDTLGSI